MIFSNNPWFMLRFGLVFLSGSLVTWNFYSFSHFVHHQHFEPPHGPHHGDPTNWNPHDDQGDHHHGENQHDDHGDHHHGGNPFEGIYLKKDELFLYGLALPLALLTLVSLIWNPSTSPKGTSTKRTEFLPSFFCLRNKLNAQTWSILFFLLPLLLITYDASTQHFSGGNSQEKENWFIRLCMSLMSISGYGAIWALALFLIPVTKHSPILDWLHVTPVQALAFHRLAGWTSLWYSVLHGFLHLRHLMDVLNGRRPDPRPWYKELMVLLIPPSWKCIADQNPLAFLEGHQHFSEPDDRCRLALVNATGMISTLAFVVLGITSLPRVRRSCYALFYMTHIPMGWIMLITAIWHYPSCALVAIPNIIYYLSFNVPIYVSQAMKYWSLRGKTKGSHLVEANLIQGGSIELIFATEKKDQHRHENRFVRISHPSLSVVESHPFSVFSRQELTGEGVDVAGSIENNSPSPTTLSILLKPTGNFTKGLAKILFPNHHANDEPNTQEEDSILDPLIPKESSRRQTLANSTAVSSLSPQSILHFDSYYAGSFDWTDRAMLNHDEILVVAGGVGIAPFLEFLPALQQRIHADTTVDVAASVDVDSETLLQSNIASFGPKRVHLHWYCREVGLASYVWYSHLRHHIQQAWEANPACQGRLKIHMHLTSMSSTPSSEEEETFTGEETLKNIPNSGLTQKHYYASDDGNYNPVKDSRTAQSWQLGLVLPGSIMVAGTILHWWFYNQVIINDQFRRGNLIIRAHSIVFTLLLAIVVCVLVEVYLCYHGDTHTAQRQEQDVVVEENEGSGNNGSTDHDVKCMEFESENDSTSFLKVSKGRPSIDDVVHDILQAKQPGVYMCGPRPLMESVETSIRRKHSDCAFYREDSEM